MAELDVTQMRIDIDKIRAKEPFYQLGLGTEIPAGADLNDYKTPGTYYWAGDSYLTIKNHPNNEFNGLMIVRQHTDGEVIQDIWSSNSTQAWRRTWYNEENRWLDWSCTSGVDSIVAKGVTNGWNWTKYASGKFEACGYFTRTTAGVESWGYDWYVTPFSIPAPFTVTGVDFMGAFGQSDLMKAGNFNFRSQNFEFILFASHSIEPGRSYSFFIELKGNWK